MTFWDSIRQFIKKTDDNLVKFINFSESASKIIVASTTTILKEFSSMFADNNVLVFGDKQSGKTALILLMANNHPYEIIDNKKIINPTAMGVIIGKKYDLKVSEQDQGKKITIPKDVGGEFRFEWKRMIKEFNPEGIIYMLDGRKEKEDLLSSVKEIFDDVLSSEEGLDNLKALHIFVNFEDIWNPDSNMIIKTKKISQVSDGFIENFSTNQYYMKKFTKLDFKVSITQLYPEKKHWNESKKALKELGIALKNKANN
ncbi:MAG: hypothetical protein AAGE84_21545 [Cyanobacteria bacterium P01_G01_bin.39]